MTTSDLALRYRSSDPGLRRLTTASRAAGTWLTVVGVLAAGAALLGLPTDFLLPGMIVVSATTMSLGMDIAPRKRFIPLLLTAATATIGFTAGTFVVGDTVVTTISFFALGLATLAATAAGARGTLLALVAVGAFYATTLVRPDPSDLGLYLVSAVLGSLISAVLLGVVLRENPRREQSRLLASVRATATLAIAARRVDPRALEVRLGQLTRVVMLCRRQIAQDPGVWRPEMRDGDGDALVAWELRFDRAMRLADEDRGVRDGRTSTAELLLAPWRPRDGESDARLAMTASSKIRAHDENALPAARGGRSLLSTGVQLATACILALVASQLVDPVHWFWGVLAALVMLFGTSSAADAVGKGLRRVAGTAAGLPLGLVLATITHDSLPWAMVVVVVALFVQQYLADLAYSWSMVALTVMLGVLFGQTGSDPVTVLDSRLLLTALGAVIGIVVALTVVPTRTGTLLARRADDALAAADATLEAIASSRPASTVSAADRETTERFLLLEAEACASRRGWPFGRAHRAIEALLGAGAVALLDLRRVVDEYRSRGPAAADPSHSIESPRRRIVDIRSGLSDSSSTSPAASADAGAPRASVEADGACGEGDTAIRRLDTSLAAVQDTLRRS